LEYIPRFVPPDNYAAGFGFQWLCHARTQHDRYSGTRISEQRFFAETRWPRRLEGQLILEVGCGSGRFTAQALSTGATVVAVDLSQAVDVNRSCQAEAENLLLVQADLYGLPFAGPQFDKVFCLGVLQHTPDVRQAFFCLPEFLKPGGQLVVDVYDQRPGLLGMLASLCRTYYWVRPLTRRMPPERLHRWVSWYVDRMWPLARRINRLPGIGRRLNRLLLIADYRGRYRLTEEQLKEWAVLDTFDMLSPRYDQRQTLQTVRRWFQDAPLDQIDVRYGHNGIEGRGVKCPTGQ
jgi:SAM-dependent methyltransferase